MTEKLGNLSGLENRYKQENINCIFFLELTLKQVKVLPIKSTQTNEQTKTDEKQERITYFFFH